LLEQSDAFLRLPQLDRVGLGDAGLDPVFDVRDLQPPLQAGLGDPEVLRDPTDRASPLRATATTSRRNSLGNAFGTLTILP
jgi:hypothetical protein